MHAPPETNATGAPSPVKQVGFLKSLGPGLVTGAADDDPSGIATATTCAAIRLKCARPRSHLCWPRRHLACGSMSI